jgi:hypothetical protein
MQPINNCCRLIGLDIPAVPKGRDNTELCLIFDCIIFVGITMHLRIYSDEEFGQAGDLSQPEV